MRRFKLEKSKIDEDWWVITDTDNLVVIKFKEHMFDETKKVSVIDEDKLKRSGDMADVLSGIVSDIEDYMLTHYLSLAIPTPAYEFREDDDGYIYLLHNNSPKFKVLIQEACDLSDLSKAFKGAGDFVDGYVKKVKEQAKERERERKKDK